MAAKTQLMQSIRQAYPEVQFKSVRMHGGEGQFNHILIANESIIFRFPRYAAQIDNLDREVFLLSYLQDKLPLPVPNPIYYSNTTRSVGKVFMGYRLLPGRSLWRAYLQTIDDTEELKRLAMQLASFLTTLHHLPIAALEDKFSDHDGPAFWTDMYRDIRENLFPLMSNAAVSRVSKHFDDFLGAGQNRQYKPAIRHGDFGGSNILYDTGTRSISGIIDFGSAGLGDPAVDLAAVSTYGEPFFGMICEHYPGIETMLERALFYRGTFALQEALHGFHSGDEEAFENGIAGYRE
jgi:aminoglycoside 2''-phosphotransferase